MLLLPPPPPPPPPTPLPALPALASVLLTLAVLLGSAPVARAQFVVPEGSEFHNGSSLATEDDGDSDVLLQRLDEALARADGGEAVEVVTRLRMQRRPALVRFGPRTHVPALELASRRIAASDAPELIARVEAHERGLVDEARRLRDVDRLVDHALRGSGFASSGEAARAAGRLLFEQGHWWAASALLGRGPSDRATEELDRVARERAGMGSRSDVGAPAATGPAQFSWQLAFPRPLDVHPDAPLPTVLPGREREALILDTMELLGFDTQTGMNTVVGFRWDEAVLAGLKEERYVTALPAPRRLAAARAGRRLVLPFNTPYDFSRDRDLSTHRIPHLVAVDLIGSPMHAGLTRPLPVASPGARLAWVASVESRKESTAYGPPTIVGDRVFVQVFRTSVDTEVSLACFDLESGALRFESPLVRGAQIPRFGSRLTDLAVSDLDKRAREGPPAYREGLLWCCTGFGMVAAVDAWSGDVLLTFRYDRVFSLEKEVFDPAFLFDPDPGSWDDEPVRFWNDRVVVAPSDSRYLYMLAPTPGERGHLILDDPIEKLDRRHIATLLRDPGGSASPSVLATARRDGLLRLVHLSPDGHVLERSAPLSAEDTPEGWPWPMRPLTVGQSVLLPTALGVAVFDREDLSRPPGRLPLGPQVPDIHVAEIHRVDGGLVAVSPFTVTRDVVFQYWRDAR